MLEHRVSLGRTRTSWLPLGEEVGGCEQEGKRHILVLLEMGLLS